MTTSPDVLCENAALKHFKHFTLFVCGLQSCAKMSWLLIQTWMLGVFKGCRALHCIHVLLVFHTPTGKVFESTVGTLWKKYTKRSPSTPNTKVKWGLVSPFLHLAHGHGGMLWIISLFWCVGGERGCFLRHMGVLHRLTSHSSHIHCLGSLPPVTYTSE